ncbi:MAG: aspartate ammonia-lyase, partial [Burkholderia sp.]|nr:aspartate ammonia-lyase [Burkholderia sp.]
MTENGFRVEADLLGKRSIPVDAYYGVHTLRAKENFDISGRTIASLQYLVMALRS